MDKMMRIRGEIPTFKRCCMCLPLRHGLIVWGYVRLVIGVILLVGVTKGFLAMLRKSKEKEGYEVFIGLFGFLVILAGTDIVLNVVLVYAGHRKDLKMLRAYYIYSFVLWAVLILLGIPLCGHAIYLMNIYEMELGHILIMSIDVANFLALILIQAYILLLVRSEFVKLSNDCEFRFVNNAAESACRMKCEEENLINKGDIKGEGNITAKRDEIAITNNISNGNITVRRDILANRDKEGVYKNGTNKSDNILIY